MAVEALQRTLGRDAVFVTASTGIAACAIGGTTVHSFAGIGLGKEPAETLAAKVVDRAASRKRWLSCRALVIDEVSMLDGASAATSGLGSGGGHVDRATRRGGAHGGGRHFAGQLFDKLEHIARAVKGQVSLPRRASSPAEQHFGGIQLVLCGDFFQLPPVGMERDASIKFLFETAAWRRSGLKPVVLRQVFRQKEVQFVSLLDEMRRARLSDFSLAVLSHAVASPPPIMLEAQTMQAAPPQPQQQPEAWRPPSPYMPPPPPPAAPPPQPAPAQTPPQQPPPVDHAQGLSELEPAEVNARLPLSQPPCVSATGPEGSAPAQHPGSGPGPGLEDGAGGGEGPGSDGVDDDTDDFATRQAVQAVPAPAAPPAAPPAAVAAPPPVQPQLPRTLATRLFPNNDAADRENNAKLNQLPGERRHWIACDEDRANHLSGCMAPARLSLRVGAQVILLKNLDQQAKLVPRRALLYCMGRRAYRMY